MDHRGAEIGSLKKNRRPGRGTGAQAVVRQIYDTLDAAYGGEHWHWMPDVARPIDVIAGAVLVQHTNWRNAERALDALREAGALNIDALAAMPEEHLATLVRASGTPSVKARRLRALARTIRDAGGLGAFLVLPPAEMRTRLLATHGIGAESADAIALYAAGKRIFVVDAYTRRVFRRLGHGPAGNGYEHWRAWFESALQGEPVEVFQRYHAWLVLHAKAVCHPAPRCAACPLLAACAHGRALATEASASRR